MCVCVCVSAEFENSELLSVSHRCVKSCLSQTEGREMNAEESNLRNKIISGLESQELFSNP